MRQANFKAEVKASIGYARRDGATVTLDDISADAASFSGTDSEWQFHTRMVTLCGAAGSAKLTVKFRIAEALLRGELDRLLQSLRPTGC